MRFPRPVGPSYDQGVSGSGLIAIRKKNQRATLASGCFELHLAVQTEQVKVFCFEIKIENKTPKIFKISFFSKRFRRQGKIA